MGKDKFCFLEELPPIMLRVLEILSLAPLLDDKMAAVILWCQGMTRTTRMVAQVKEYPLWHQRTNKTWVIDDDVYRRLTGKLSSAEKEKTYEAIYAGLIGRMKKETRGTDPAFSDYFMNSVRVALKIRSRRMWAIGKVGELVKSGDPEIRRACFLYLEEAGININERSPLQ